MNRRRFLGWTGGLGISLAGCLGYSAPRSKTLTVTRQAPYAGPVRCRGDPVAVVQTYMDQPGYEDDREYFPENKTLRYVAATSGGEPALFNTQSFEEWGSIECASVGAKRVRNATASRLGTDDFSAGVGHPGGREPSSSTEVAIVLTVTTRNNVGESVRTPPVPLARLADVAPRTANSTVSIEGDTFSRAVPVFASHTESSEVWGGEPFVLLNKRLGSCYLELTTLS